MGFDRYSISRRTPSWRATPPYQITIPSRFRRSDEHKHLSAGRKPAQLTKKMGFEASVERENLGKKASHSELLCAELSTSSMIANGFPSVSATIRLTVRLIEWPGPHCSEQLTAAIWTSRQMHSGSPSSGNG